MGTPGVPGTTVGIEATTTPGENPPTTVPGATTPSEGTTLGISATTQPIEGPPARLNEESSGAANTALVVGLVAGGAVAAGIAAVAIGFIVGGPGATAAAPVSAMPATGASTNPLYQAATSGGENP